MRTIFFNFFSFFFFFFQEGSGACQHPNIGAGKKTSITFDRNNIF